MKPTKGPLSNLTDQEFYDFTFHVGLLVFQSPKASAFARHANPLETVRDYFDINSTSRAQKLAGEYWKDLASRNLNTEALCLKWYGRSSKDIHSEASGLLEEDL